jgi:hypothetical protein
MEGISPAWKMRFGYMAGRPGSHWANFFAEANRNTIYPISLKKMG